MISSIFLKTDMRSRRQDSFKIPFDIELEKVKQEKAGGNGKKSVFYCVAPVRTEGLGLVDYQGIYGIGRLCPFHFTLIVITVIGFLPTEEHDSCFGFYALIVKRQKQGCQSINIIL